MPIVSAIFLVVGLLLVAAAVPLMRRRVSPKAGYGLRVPATHADEWVWYEANARTGRGLAALGLLLATAAVALPRVASLTPDALAVVLTGLLVLGVVANATWGWALAERLLRERQGRRAR